MSRKVMDVSANDFTNDKGQYTHTNVNEREKHVAAITIAHQDGNLEMLQSSSEVGDFVTKYADPIADAILKRNQPLYELKPDSGRMARSPASLPRVCRLCPIAEERGLFDVQTSLRHRCQPGDEEHTGTAS